jgi:lipid II:glycine glycyltransferase (peptidoglycan interpeptide bridge formation enzyme)
MITVVKKIDESKRKLPILASEKYLKVKSDKYGWICNDNYILPYFLDTRLIFTRMVFTYGLIAKQDKLTVDNEKEFLDDMVDFVKKEKLCDFIYKAQSNVIFHICPKESDCVPWGTYEVDLSLSHEELLKSFHGKHRNVVRKAIKDGVEIQISTDIKLIQGLISDTMTRQNVIHFPSLEYLLNLQDSIPENLLLLVARKGDKLQGVAVFIYDKEKSYYMYGGSSRNPYTGSINLLHFEAMKLLQERGAKKYDFVGARLNIEKGSKYEGLDRFKSRFGTSLIQGYAFRTIINPFKFKLFNIISKIYLKLKGYDYIDPIDSINGTK